MKKFCVLLLLSITCNYLLAQQKTVFKEKYLSNKIYITHDSTTTNVNLTFSGSPDEVSKIKARGLKSPTASSTRSDRTVFLTTDSIKEDGSLPLTFRFNIRSSARVNNVDIPGAKDVSNSTDVKAIYTSGDKISITSIDGQTPYDQKTAFENLLNAPANKFPRHITKSGRYLFA